MKMNVAVMDENPGSTERSGEGVRGARVRSTWPDAASQSITYHHFRRRNGVTKGIGHSEARVDFGAVSVLKKPKKEYNGWPAG